MMSAEIQILGRKARIYMPIRSAPLVLTLEFARAERSGDPFGFRFAPQEYLCRSERGGFENAELRWGAALMSDLAELRQLRPDPTLLQRIGDLLRTFVTPFGWSHREPQILQALREGRRVVVAVRSAAAELYALPWELLTVKASGQHIGELPAVLVRYEWPETETIPHAPIVEHARGRILLAWSAAGGAVPATEHVAALSRATQDSGYFVAARDVLPNVTCGTLAAALVAAEQEQRPISVLHILCHGTSVGSTFGLALHQDGDASKVEGVDAGRLRRILAPYGATLRLVVLSACDSSNAGELGNQLGSIAQALHRAGLAMVIASRYPLSINAANCLVGELYHRLIVHGDSVEEALIASRSKLAIDTGHLDWASLQFYARSADGDGAHVFQMQAKQHPKHRPILLPMTQTSEPRSSLLPLLLAAAIGMGATVSGTWFLVHNTGHQSVHSNTSNHQDASTLELGQPSRIGTAPTHELILTAPTSQPATPVTIPASQPPSQPVECKGSNLNASCNQYQAAQGSTIIINAKQHR